MGKRIFYLLSILMLCGNLKAGPLYNPDELKTFKVELISMEKITFANKPFPFIQLLARYNNQLIPVNIGPSWFFQATAGFTLSPKDHLEITGVVRTIEGRCMIEAIRLKKRTMTFQILDESGEPLWSKPFIPQQLEFCNTSLNASEK